MSKRTSFLSAALILASLPATAAEVGWTAMDYSDTRHPNADTKQITDVWGSQGHSGAFGMYASKTLPLPDGRTAFVTIAGSSDKCIPAANWEVETDTVPVCPVTVVVTDRAGKRRIATGMVCMSATLPEETDVAAGSNVTDIAVGSGEIKFRAKVEGRYPTDCVKEIPIPSAS